MTNKMHTQKFLKERKFYTVIPVIVIPCLVFIFWTLGGGAGVEAKETVTKKGLNLQLPDAKLKADNATDKMKFYEKADADSVKRREALRMDPNYKDTTISADRKRINSFRGLNGSTGKFIEDDNEQRLNTKIAALQKQIYEPVYYTKENHATKSSAPTEVDRSQMVLPSSPVKETDPEITALNGALEKILDIQHPERIKEKSLQKKTNVFIVSAQPGESDNSFFGVRDTLKVNAGFHGENVNGTKPEVNSIPAEIDGTQILQNGSVIKLRLLIDIYVSGNRIPYGASLFGICSLEEERLQVHISSVGYHNNIMPVSLSVYDLSGLSGIYTPGSVTRDVAKQTADQSLQSIGILNMDPSLGSQLSAAGIGAAKSLLAKKVRQVKVTVKAGYRVLLHDDNTQYSTR